MVYLEAPELKPVTRKTLLDVANVITDAPAYALQNQLKYEPRIMDGANRLVPEPGEKKIFDKRAGKDSFVTPELFTAYRGLDESLLNGMGAGAAELEALFAAGEPLFVEEQVQKLLLNPQAEDITPDGGAMTDAKAVLGLLEQWMATRFLYQPMLSGNLLAINLIQPGVPTITETPHGAPIASAAGYGAEGPGGRVAGPGAAWLYISGQINIWPGKAQAAVSGPNLERNRDLSLVEKSYAASIDGPVAAILIGY